MPEVEWGVKHICLSCDAKFYDMRKSPAACPRCGTAEAAGETSGASGPVADDKDLEDVVVDDSEDETLEPDDEAGEWRRQLLGLAIADSACAGARACLVCRLS